MFFVHGRHGLFLKVNGTARRHMREAVLDLFFYVIAVAGQQRRKFAVHAVPPVHLRHKIQHLQVILARRMPQAAARDPN